MTINELPVYELYAIRYATREAQRRNHFIGGDPHDGPMPMDYFVWAAVGPERSFVIDLHQGISRGHPPGIIFCASAQAIQL